MILKKKYVSLADTLHYLILQIREGLDFCRDWLPANIEGPHDVEFLFQLLKSKVVFINDPPRIELLMTPATFATKQNFWGIKFAGDCDDFTIFATACALACPSPIPCRIILAGRNSREAVHIYNEMKNGAGLWRPFDLTEDFYGSEREYKYKQIINI